MHPILINSSTWPKPSSPLQRFIDKFDFGIMKEANSEKISDVAIKRGLKQIKIAHLLDTAWGTQMTARGRFLNPRGPKCKLK